MLNDVTLLGRLAQDPDFRHTPNNTPVASFDLAVSGIGKDSPTDFIPIVCWKETANFAGRYLQKGRQIVVKGRISTRKFTDKDGKNRKVLEVTASRIFFADSKTESREQNTAGSNQSSGDLSDGYEEIIGDEDLPF